MLSESEFVYQRDNAISMLRLHAISLFQQSNLSHEIDNSNLHEVFADLDCDFYTSFVIETEDDLTKCASA